MLALVTIVRGHLWYHGGVFPQPDHTVVILLAVAPAAALFALVLVSSLFAMLPASDESRSEECRMILAAMAGVTVLFLPLVAFLIWTEGDTRTLAMIFSLALADLALTFAVLKYIDA